MAGLVAAVAAIEEAVVAVPAEQWTVLDAATLRDLNTRLLRIESRLGAVRLAAVRRLDALDIARSEGASSTGDLLARGHGGDGRIEFRKIGQRSVDLQ